MSSEPTHIEPGDLAAVLQPLMAEALLGFDVDGVLAPIVEHADDARLSPGVHDALSVLGSRTVVAIVSGRCLTDLERLFAFPPGLHVIGSHGLEARDSGGVTLDDQERATFEQLEILGAKAVEAAGEGAWLEYKPASVVVHTRSADPEAARAAIDAVARLARLVAGAQLKPGHHVLELLARSASKGDALLGLARRLERSPLIFFGDDVTDEDAFAQMGADDISVRVGAGDTVARYRIDGPADVVTILRSLCR